MSFGFNASWIIPDIDTYIDLEALKWFQVFSNISRMHISFTKPQLLEDLLITRKEIFQRYCNIMKQKMYWCKNFCWAGTFPIKPSLGAWYWSQLHKSILCKRVGPHIAFCRSYLAMKALQIIPSDCYFCKSWKVEPVTRAGNTQLELTAALKIILFKCIGHLLNLVV